MPEIHGHQPVVPEPDDQHAIISWGSASIHDESASHGCIAARQRIDRDGGETGDIVKVSSRRTRQEIQFLGRARTYRHRVIALARPRVETMQDNRKYLGVLEKSVNAGAFRNPDHRSGNAGGATLFGNSERGNSWALVG